jgi:lysophosphatidic acid acyltransferase/lysophosphatidylinositol acyltransferase
MLLFPEGTRFTEEKHEKSLEVARKKGLPLLQHHLLPRAKGFVVSIQALKGKCIFSCIITSHLCYIDLFFVLSISQLLGM